MRRKDREINDRTVIDEIIRGCQVCHLGMSVDDQPYVVPLSFGYDGDAVYFHSALLGRKLDILRQNPRVCVEFERAGDLVTGPQACNWSVQFASVVGFGTAHFVEDPADKRAALSLLMAQYTGGEFHFPDGALERTTIIKIQLESLTGKHTKTV